MLQQIFQWMHVSIKYVSSIHLKVIMIQKAYNTLFIMITASSTDNTEMNFLKVFQVQNGHDSSFQWLYKFVIFITFFAEKLISNTLCISWNRYVFARVEMLW